MRVLLGLVFNLRVLYTRSEKSRKKIFKPVGGLGIEKPKNCYFTLDFSSPMRWGGKNDMNNTFVLRGNKSTQWRGPPKLQLGLPQWGEPNYKFGGLLVSKTSANHLLFFENILEKAPHGSLRCSLTLYCIQRPWLLKHWPLNYGLGPK